MAEWELSKENIQPLRKGRKVSAILEDPKKIAEEKQAHEMALRTYDGDDPLEPWFSYILWVEQSYAKAGKDGNLNTLLEKCIKEFKGSKYDQDPRFLEVWMKYANLSTHALEVYNFMYSESVCDTLAEFYIEWSWQLEQVTNYKKAEQTFKMAKSKVNTAGGLEMLETKHKQFQARVMKRMLEKSHEDPDEAANEEQRGVLSSLKSKVSSVRVGAAKIAEGPGVLRPDPAGGGQSQASKSNTSHKFRIYSEDENQDPNHFQIYEGSSGKSLPFGKERNRENEQDPGKWTQSRIGKKSHAVPLNKINAKPAFEVHQDEGLVTPTPSKSGNPSGNVLASHKPKKDEDEVPIALALFEPPDPTKKPMYCKHLVYQGVTEFSFEEIRAARYRQQEAREEAARLDKIKQQQEKEARNKEALLAEKERMLRLEMEAFQKQRMDFERNMMQMKQMLQDQQDEIEALKTREKGDVNEFKIPPAAAAGSKFKIYSDQGSKSSVSQSQSSVSLDDTKTLLQKDPLCSSKTPPRLQRELSQPSPTINTKEAMNLMQEMWGRSEEKPPTANAENTLKKNKTEPFEVFQEEVENPQPFRKAKEEKAFKIYEEPEAPLIKKPAPKFQIFQDDKENQAVLKPAMIEPAKPTIQVHDDDEEEDEAKTMFVPSMADFAKMAQAASTPFNGRGFIPEDDENTCAVNVIFKKPSAPTMTMASGSSLKKNTEDLNTELSTIMETSKENYKSSSTSSSEISSKSHCITTNKSHWGNTQHNIQSHTPAPSASATTINGMSTLKPVEMTTSSGYMADSSSAKTPHGNLLLSKRNMNSPSASVQGKEKKIKYDESNEDLDFEPTAMLDVVSQFQKEMVQERKMDENSFMATSFNPSFMEQKTDNLSLMCKKNMSKLDITKPNDMTNFKVDLEESGLQAASPSAPQLDLTEQVLETSIANMSLQSADLNPFDSVLHAALLKKIAEPVESRHGFVQLKHEKLPVFRLQSNVQLGPHQFSIMECKGEGGYGKVFKAMISNADGNDTVADLDAVLKVQKPARPWEFYICSEIHKRLRNSDTSCFMSMPRCYNFADGSVFASEHQMLSLLDICNIVNSMKRFNVEPIAMYFTIELLNILDKLQQAHIIHGDIKPDNFLVAKKPALNVDAEQPQDLIQKCSLQTIDFGVSIDMKLFSEDQKFTHKFDKVDNRCPQMLDGQSWSYHLDYFGVASVAHTLLHGSYMKLSKKNDQYVPNGSLKRWWQTELWAEFFASFLNIKGDDYPDVKQMRAKFEQYLFEKLAEDRLFFDAAASELNTLMR